MTNKFKVLDLVKHVIDEGSVPMIITGVIERPNGYTYFATTANATELEYYEQELVKYKK